MRLCTCGVRVVAAPATRPHDRAGCFGAGTLVVDARISQLCTCPPIARPLSCSLFLRRCYHLHAKVRVEVEFAFGRLMGRWNVIRKICAHPGLASAIQEAAVALHNFLEAREGEYEEAVRRRRTARRSRRTRPMATSACSLWVRSAAGEF